MGNKRLNGGDEFQVHLILHGDCGNPDIDLKQQIISVSGEVKDNDDGTYEVAYAPTVSGVYELNVTLGTWSFSYFQYVYDHWYFSWP